MALQTIKELTELTNKKYERAVVPMFQFSNSLFTQELDFTKNTLKYVSYVMIGC